MQRCAPPHFLKVTQSLGVQEAIERYSVSRRTRKQVRFDLLKCSVFRDDYYILTDGSSLTSQSSVHPHPILSDEGTLFGHRSLEGMEPIIAGYTLNISINIVFS